MQIKPNFYKNTICLNVLANDIQNAKDICSAAEGHVLIGLLSKNYSTTNNAVDDMKKYSKEINNAISVGLGGENSSQSYMVTDILRSYIPQHVNQVFPAVSGAREVLNNYKTFINALVSPTGKPGYVKISTGPLSSKSKEEGIIPIKTAILMIKEMGGNSIKFFPMDGLKTLEEYKVICQECAKYNFAIEPTGGITKENFKEICSIAYNAGVKGIIPHVYTSIIDESGKTNIEDVKFLYGIMKEITNE